MNDSPIQPTTSASLPRQVKALGAVSFFNDIASEMIFPLLPAFVTGVLGLGPQVLGVMEGSAETVASLLKYFSGWWSDKLDRRKPLAVAGYALSCSLRPLFAVAGAAWHIVALRSIDRVGKGLRTSPRDALLSQSVDEGMRGRAFGFHRAMDHAGAVVGPLLAMALLGLAHLELRTVFLLTIIPGVITVFFFAFVVREKSAGSEVAGKAPDAPTDGLIPHEKTDRRNFTIFLAAMIVFTLGNSTDVFLVLHAQELGVPVALAPLLWMILHLSKMSLSTWGGALSDRIGRKRAIMMGWGVYALVYLGFALANRAWMVWPLFILYGFYYGLTEGPEKAMTADLVPKDKRGRGFGLYHMSVGIAAFPASVAAGFLWKSYGAGSALGLGAVFAAAAALLLGIGLNHTHAKIR